VLVNCWCSRPTSQHGSVLNPLLGVVWWFRDAGSVRMKMREWKNREQIAGWKMQGWKMQEWKMQE